MNLYSNFFYGKVEDKHIDKISKIAERIHRETFFSCEEVIKGINSIISFYKPYNIADNFEYSDFLKIFHKAISMGMEVSSFILYIDSLSREEEKEQNIKVFYDSNVVKVKDNIENINLVKKLKFRKNY